MQQPVDYDQDAELDRRIERIMQRERRINRMFLSLSVSALSLGILLGVIYVLRA